MEDEVETASSSSPLSEGRLVEALLNDLDPRPSLRLVQANLRHCRHDPNSLTLLRRWVDAGLPRALLQQLLRDHFLPLALLEDVADTAALLLARPDLHPPFAAEWARVVAAEGLTDALLFVLCRCLHVPGFVRALVDLNFTNLVQELYVQTCVIPRKKASAPSSSPFSTASVDPFSSAAGLGRDQWAFPETNPGSPVVASSPMELWGQAGGSSWDLDLPFPASLSRLSLSSPELSVSPGSAALTFPPAPKLAGSSFRSPPRGDNESPGRAAMRVQLAEGKRQSRPSTAQSRGPPDMDGVPLGPPKSSALTDLQLVAGKMGHLYVTLNVTKLLALRRQTDTFRTAAQPAPMWSSPVPALLASSGIPHISQVRRGSRPDARDRRTRRSRLVDAPLYYTLCGLSPDRRSGRSPDCQRLLLLLLLRHLTLHGPARARARCPVNMLVYEYHSLANYWPVALLQGEAPHSGNDRFEGPSALRHCFPFLVLEIAAILRHYSLRLEGRYWPLWQGRPSLFASLAFSEHYKKYDLFAWRWLVTVNASLAQDGWEWPLTHHYLYNMAQYCRGCLAERRVLGLHVAHMCIEQLVELLRMCEERDSADLAVAKAVYYLVDIFDSLIHAQKAPEVCEVLRMLFVDRSSRHAQWLEAYTRELLRESYAASELARWTSREEDLTDHDQLTGAMPALPEVETDMDSEVGDLFFQWQEHLGLGGPYLLLPHLFSLERCRQRLVLHQHSLLYLIESRGGGNGPDGTEGGCRMAEKQEAVLATFNHLVSPGEGEMVKFLSNGPADHQFLVKAEMLKFLCALLAAPASPFLAMDAFCNSAIRFHYLSFLHLYTGDSAKPGPHPREMRLCELHLRVLLTLSVHKTAYIAQTMHKLQVVPFLAHEVQLEAAFLGRRQHYLALLEQQLREKDDSHGSDDDPLSGGSGSGSSKRDGRPSPLEGMPASRPSGLLPPGGEEEGSPTRAVLSPKRGAAKVPPLEHLGPLRRLSVTMAPGAGAPTQERRLSIGTAKPLGLGGSAPGNPTTQSPRPKRPFIPPLKLGAHVKAHSWGVQGGFVEEGELSAASRVPSAAVLPLASARKTPAPSSPLHPPSLVPSPSPSSPKRGASSPSLPRSPLGVGRTFMSPTKDAKDTEDEGTSKDLSPHPSMGSLLDFSYREPEPPSGTPATFQDDAAFYAMERSGCRMYSHLGVHLNVLLLLLSLLCRPDDTLDPLYCESFPTNNKKTNVLYILHQHLNHPSNKFLGPLLYRRMARLATAPSSAFLLLVRLLCTSLGDPSMYTKEERIGGGAYGTIWRCRVTSLPLSSDGVPFPHDLWQGTHYFVPDMALKKIALPLSSTDRCALYDLFNEVLIMVKLSNDAGICQIRDFGVSDQGYFIAMKLYSSSLRQWRLQESRPLHEMFPVYLEIFKMVVRAVCTLHENHVYHNDLKCDNILLDYDGCNGLYQLNPEGAGHLNAGCLIVLADFGESVVQGASPTCASPAHVDRGTECIRSPEVLQAFREEARGKCVQPAKVDVWALGCLFYELLTAEFLFLEASYMKFWNRVCSVTEPALEADHLDRVGRSTLILYLLNGMLAKDPSSRWSAGELHQRLLAVTAAETAAALVELRAFGDKSPPRAAPAATPAQGVPKAAPPTESKGSSPTSPGDIFANILNLESLEAQGRCRCHSASHATSGALSPLDSFRGNTARSKANASSPEPSAALPFAAECVGSRKFNLVSPVIDGKLYIGPASMAAAYQLLYSLGVTHLVNLSAHPPFQPHNFLHDQLLADLQTGHQAANDMQHLPRRPKRKSEASVADANACCAERWVKSIDWVNAAISKGSTVFVYACDGSPLAHVFAVTHLMLTYGVDFVSATLWLKRQCLAIATSVGQGAHDVLWCIAMAPQCSARLLRPKFLLKNDEQHSRQYQCLCGMTVYAKQHVEGRWYEHAQRNLTALLEPVASHVICFLQELSAVYSSFPPPRLKADFFASATARCGATPPTSPKDVAGTYQLPVAEAAFVVVPQRAFYCPSELQVDLCVECDLSGFDPLRSLGATAFSCRAYRCATCGFLTHLKLDLPEATDPTHARLAVVNLLLGPCNAPSPRGAIDLRPYLFSKSTKPA